MRIKVHIAPILQENCDLPPTMEVEGKTVGECLDDLVKKQPGAKDKLFDKNGLLTVFVSINDEVTVSPDTPSMERSVKEDDVLRLFAIITGG